MGIRWAFVAVPSSSRGIHHFFDPPVHPIGVRIPRGIGIYNSRYTFLAANNSNRYFIYPYAYLFAWKSHTWKVELSNEYFHKN
jgi:hypothetical protein